MASISNATLQSHLGSILGNERNELRDSVVPTLLVSVAHISALLRSAHSVSQVGSSNAFGDEQLNVDVLSEQAVRDALAKCPSVVTASSEEDPVERPTRPSTPDPEHQSNRVEENASAEEYTVAFDPLDGSSIISSDWTIGTIIGIWEGATALRQSPRKRQIAAILGVCGPRTSAMVAVRLPGWIEGVCFEVGISTIDVNSSQQPEMKVVVPDIKLQPHASVKTRYFAPANLRAAATDQNYLDLVNHYIKSKYTLRYSGGLVPDVVHTLTKGHGVYISPVSADSKPKLRKLYELFPVALVIECAGGKALDTVSGEDVLDKEVVDVEERGGLFCGTAEEVDMVVEKMLRR